MNKKIKIILGVSLLLNLVMFGSVLGWGIHEYYEHREKIQFVKKFKHSPAVRDLIQDVRSELKQHRRETAEILHDMSAILQAENYDAVSLQQQLDALKQIHVSRYDWLSDEALAVIEGFSAQEREQLAIMIAHIARHEGKRHGGKYRRRE